MTGVLHPWGRQLPYHPHIHSIVPGGGLSKDRATWRPARATCVPVTALSPISRALVKESGATPDCWSRSTPRAGPSPGTSTSGQLLTATPPSPPAPPLSSRRPRQPPHRGPHGPPVPFPARKVGSARPRTAPWTSWSVSAGSSARLAAWRMKVRHFGFLHASGASRSRPSALIGQGHPSEAQPLPRTPPRAARCPTCGAPMHVVMRVWTSHSGFVDTG